MNIRTLNTKAPKAETPSPRLLHLRATGSLCYETEQLIHQQHKWKAGRCAVCGVVLSTPERKV